MQNDDDYTRTIGILTNYSQWRLENCVLYQNRILIWNESVATIFILIIEDDAIANCARDILADLKYQASDLKSLLAFATKHNWLNVGLLPSKFTDRGY